MISKLSQHIVLITGNAHPVLANSLEAAGYKVDQRPTISEEEAATCIENYTGLILTTRFKADQALLQKAVLLKWIGRLGSGMELIDTDFAAQQGIVCVSSPEGNRLSVAEHVLGMILGLNHKIAAADLEVRNRQWRREQNQGIELSGKTVGIIGFGNTGSELARLLVPFNVNLLVYDRYKTGFGNEFVKESTLEAIQQQAEIISFHVPLTNFTSGMVNTLFLNTLQKQPLLVNTSRGGIVNLGHLIIALEQKKLRGVALDVLPNENLYSYTPLENEQLERLIHKENVLLTPHIAGYSIEAFERISTVLLDKLGIKVVF
ncbi:MAG: hydroxyacid dehydrogenase [Bacteroidetes bacterium]|nr:hydroxyacid dehydrogenase [Bacteroidota bacterium]